MATPGILALEPFLIGQSALFVPLQSVDGHSVVWMVVVAVENFHVPSPEPTNGLPLLIYIGPCCPGCAAVVGQ